MTGEKGGEDGTTKILISGNEKSYLDEIKILFDKYLRAIIW